MRWSLGGAEEGTITVALCYSVRQTCCFLRLNILLMEQYFSKFLSRHTGKAVKLIITPPPSPPRLHHVEIMADFSVSTCCFGHHNRIWSIYEIIVLSGCYCEAKNFFSLLQLKTQIPGTSPKAITMAQRSSHFTPFYFCLPCPDLVPIQPLPFPLPASFVQLHCSFDSEAYLTSSHPK